jgi:hypothetical protein
MEIITTMKSMAFHPLRKYEISPLKRKPKEIIFRSDSARKKEVRMKSEYSRKYASVLCGLLRGLSSASNILEIAIKNRMNISNF